MYDVNRLIEQGNVPFRVLKRHPQWPQQCVVCSLPCAESVQLDSVTKQKAYSKGGKGYTVVKGLQSFQVPVHMNNAGCLTKLRRPSPLWTKVLATVASVSVGAILIWIVKPSSAKLMIDMIMLAFGVWVVAMFSINALYPPYLTIWEEIGADYNAVFSDKAYARKFADMNRDILRTEPTPEHLRWPTGN
jgi:hypothetical protein